MSADARVVVADDHAPSRAGVRIALEGHGFAVVGEAGTSDAAVAVAEATRPDVCLLDLYMPGGGIGALRAITTRLPMTAVVVLTVSAEPDDLLAAVRAGAVGYLLKTIDAERVPHALRGVLQGEAAVPRALVPHLLDEVRLRAPHRRLAFLRSSGSPLTEREWEVLELLEHGFSTREVAAQLGCAEVTVRRHVSDVVRKLGVRDRAAAVGRLREERNGV